MSNLDVIKFQLTLLQEAFKVSHAQVKIPNTLSLDAILKHLTAILMQFPLLSLFNVSPCTLNFYFSTNDRPTLP